MGLLQSRHFGTSLSWRSGNFFSFSWVLFFWILCLLLYSFVGFSLLLLWKTEWEYVFGTLFLPSHLIVWLLRDFYIGNHIPSEVWEVFPYCLACNVNVSKFDLQIVFRLTFWEIWTVSLDFNISGILKNVLWALVRCYCIIASCSFFMGYIYDLFKGINHGFFDMFFCFCCWGFFLVPPTSICFGLLLEAFFISVWSLAVPS